MAKQKTVIALISEASDLRPAELEKAAAAFQKQVSRDFAPIWGVEANILACKRATDAPAGSWPVAIRKDIGRPGAAAYHLDKDGTPFAVVAHIEGWTLSASHQILEMLACPFGNRFQTGRSMRPEDQGKKVQYLVQVCDPCENQHFAYSIDGIQVSDFYTPHFFDAKKKDGVRYDFTGAI